MNSPLVFGCALAICAMTAALAEERTPAAAGKLAVVASVESVTVRRMESAPEQLHITARGTAPSAGWTKPQLKLRDGAREGIYEFDFVAQPTPAVAAQVIRPVEATATLLKPKDYRGVRVIAASGSKEAK